MILGSLCCRSLLGFAAILPPSSASSVAALRWICARSTSIRSVIACSSVRCSSLPSLSRHVRGGARDVGKSFVIKEGWLALPPQRVSTLQNQRHQLHAVPALSPRGLSRCRSCCRRSNSAGGLEMLFSRVLFHLVAASDLSVWMRTRETVWTRRCLDECSNDHIEIIGLQRFAFGQLAPALEWLFDCVCCVAMAASIHAIVQAPSVKQSRSANWMRRV